MLVWKEQGVCSYIYKTILYTLYMPMVAINDLEEPLVPA